jgi:CHAD domain-containing protein
MVTSAGYAPTKPSTVDKLTDASSAADVVSAYLRAQVGQLRVADDALRAGEPAGVHDLRVAVRRLRSCLRVFGAIIDRSRVRPLADELRWLSDLLGAARDQEVLWARLTHALDTIPTDLVLGPVQAQVVRHLARPAAQADQALRCAMAGQRYRELQTGLDQLLAAPPYRQRAGRRALDVLPPLVAAAYRKAHDAADDPSADRDVVLHRVRRRVKRLRYALEAVEPVMGRRARRLRRRCAEVQELLGDQHDLVVLRPVLRELGTRGNGFTFGLVYGRSIEIAHRAEAAFPRRWRRLAKRARWLHA